MKMDSLKRGLKVSPFFEKSPKNKINFKKSHQEKSGKAISLIGGRSLRMRAKWGKKLVVSFSPMQEHF